MRAAIRIPSGAVELNGELALQDAMFRGFALGAVSSGVTVRDAVLSFPDATGMKGRTAYQGRAVLDFRGDSTGGARRGERPQWPDGGPHRGAGAGVVRGAAAAPGASGRRARGGDARGSLRNDGGTVRLRSRRGELLRPAPRRRSAPRAARARERHRARRLRAQGAAGRVPGRRAVGLHRPALGALPGGRPAARRAGGDGAGAGSSGRGGRSPWPARWVGPTRCPTSRCSVVGPQIYLSGRALGPMALEARAVGEQLELTGRPIADTELRLSARLKRPYPYEATLRLALGDLRALLPDTATAQGLNGSATGLLTASGALSEVESSRRGPAPGHAAAPAGRVPRRERRAVGRAVPRRTGEQRGAEAPGPGDRDQRLAASSRRRRWTSRSRAAVDLRLVESFVPALERSSGRLELPGTARGEPADPQIVGTATLVDAGLPGARSAARAPELEGQARLQRVAHPLGRPRGPGQRRPDRQPR